MNTLRDDYHHLRDRRAMMALQILIIGAGISGLSAGLALAQAGHAVTILESVSEMAEVGAGIQIAPNASRILHRLGVLEQVMSCATAISSISIRRHDSDEELNSSPMMPSLGHKYGAPMSVIHRGDLQRILLNAATKCGCRVWTWHEVVAADPCFRPRVLVRDGNSGRTCWFSGHVVIAADGMRSTIRKQMTGAGCYHDKPIPTGDAAYRLLIPRHNIQHDKAMLEMMDSDVAMRYMGPGGHIMAYPVRNHSLYNMVLLHPAKSTSQDKDISEDGWTNRGSRQEMMDLYRNWSPAIQKWLQHADNDMLEWTLYVYPPLPTWVRGSVALIGDACHPMLPYVAQGAANGIEDAAVLAMAFTCTSDVQLALGVYELVRKHRRERIAASASATRDSLHLPDGPEQRRRDENIRTGKKNPGDKWCDDAWQDYMWGVDVMRETVERWDELAAVARKAIPSHGHLDDGVTSCSESEGGMLAWLRRQVFRGWISSH